MSAPPSLADPGSPIEQRETVSEDTSRSSGGGACPTKPKRPLSEKQLENLKRGREQRDARRAERKTVKEEEHQKIRQLEEEEREVKRLKREALEKLIDERIETKHQLKQAIQKADPPKRAAKKKREESDSDDDSNDIQMPKGPDNLAPYARGPVATKRETVKSTPAAQPAAKRQQVVFI